MATFSNTLTRPQSFVSKLHSASDASPASTSGTRKCFYQADQQAKFLHLQAEIDSLLQQLQTLKQQRLASADEAATSEKAL